MAKIHDLLERFFALRKHGTTAKTELMGGLTTFLTMAYILFVNPTILSQTGMDKGALITVTALAAAFGTALIGLWARVPFAMAPGMGLNAFFAYTLVLGGQVNWQTALGVVFIASLLFLVLTMAGIREKIVRAIPSSLRISTAAGLGLFITFIGLRNMGLVTASEATLVKLGDWSPTVVLSCIGLLLMALLEVLKVRGAILIGIGFVLAGAFVIDPTVTLSMGDLVALPPSPAPLLLQLDILAALHWSMFGVIFSFMFVALFDAVGTLMACSYEANLVDDKGAIQRIDKMLEADAAAGLVGSLLGTSTTTVYVESASGIAAGARTGLASLCTAGLFLLALFLSPLIGVVPAYAVAPALVIVGVFMFRSVRHVHFEQLEEAIPAFLTIILMPLTYSISTGLCFGFLSWTLIRLFRGKFREIGPVMGLVALFSLLNLVIGAV